jgi:hypothetical protein
MSFKNITEFEHSFKATLIKPQVPGSWTYIVIPVDIETLYNVKGRVNIKGWLNKVPFRGTLLPRGNGEHYFVINYNLRMQIGAETGSEVTVSLTFDPDIREVDLPSDFAQALDNNQQARAFYDTLTFSHKKEFINWFDSAKKPETRTRRIAKAITMLENEEKPKK